MAKNIKPLPIVLGGVFAATGMAYLFWGLDMLPDNIMPIIGYLDDVVVMGALWLLFKRFQKTAKGVK